jgi:hypothetical protein
MTDTDPVREDIAALINTITDTGELIALGLRDVTAAIDRLTAAVGGAPGLSHVPTNEVVDYERSEREQRADAEYELREFAEEANREQGGNWGRF